MFFEFFLLSVFLISCNTFSVSLLHLLYCLTCIVFLDKLPFHKTQLLGARLFKGLVDIKRCRPSDFHLDTLPWLGVSYLGVHSSECNATNDQVVQQTCCVS